jgi:hypothetical protein
VRGPSKSESNLNRTPVEFRPPHRHTDRDLQLQSPAVGRVDLLAAR